MADTGDPEGSSAGAPDRLLGGRLLVRQVGTGHRAGTDAILLAAAATIRPGEVFVDVGAGVGTVGLALALREPSAQGQLVENAAESAALARQNIGLNGLSDRVQVAELDLFERQSRSPYAGAANLVVTNPPYYLAEANRVSPDAGKARAHVLTRSAHSDGHGAWLSAALSFLAPHGSLVMIHRPEALPALLEACKGRLGGVRVRSVHPRAGSPAIRILFGGKAGSRAPFGVADPLILHRADGSFTAATEKLHRGELLLPLLQTPKSRP